MAEEYFSYRPPAQHHVHVRDARVFLNATPHQYDVIWMDAFARHMIPFHLTTAEFFSELRNHLSPEGVLAVNLASSGEGGDLLRANAVVHTMRQSFPAIESFAVKGPWKADQSKAVNLIFFAGRPIEKMGVGGIIEKIVPWVERGKLPVEAVSLLNTHRAQPWERGVILTDDFAPYDLLIGSHAGEIQPAIR
jgi:hypothetical protein